MKRKNKFLVYLYPLAAILMSLFVIFGCSDDDSKPVISYEETIDLLNSSRESFLSYKETYGFSEAISMILDDLESEPMVISNGLSSDTIAIWWENQEGIMSVLRLTTLNEFVDSLDLDKGYNNKHDEGHSSIKSVTPHNNKALLLSPNYYDWKYVPRPANKRDINLYFKEKLEGRGFEVTYIRNQSKSDQNISLEHYKNWDEFGVISYHGHGIALWFNTRFGFDTGINLTEEIYNQYYSKISSEQQMFLTADLGEDDSSSNNDSYKNINLGITNAFFDNYYIDKLDNTFILMSSCESLSNQSMPNALFDSNSNSVYWGWTDVMAPYFGGWRNTRFMINQLLDHQMSCAEAYDAMIANNRHMKLIPGSWNVIWGQDWKETHLKMSNNSDYDMKLIPQAPGTVTDIDGNVYQTVIIGNQEWMAENLRVTKYSNGDAIPTGLSYNDWSNTTSGAYTIYLNDSEMLEAYGKLYNWYAVDDSRGLCPTGWHVPSEADWNELVNYVVSQGYPNEVNNENGAGNALKSCRHVGSPLGGNCDTSEHPRWQSGTHYGFDEYGFSALPGGLRDPTQYYNYLGTDGYWWSSTENSSTSAWYWSMYNTNSHVIRLGLGKTFGFSLRCVRD